MKKIVIYLLCFILVLSCSVSAFAISPYDSSQYYLNKASGIYTYNYSINFTNPASFSLWSIAPVEEYLGEFVQSATDIAGTEFYLQNKPFQNTEFTQNSQIGDVIHSGYYMPVGAFPLNIVKIRTQIDVGSNNGVNATLPEDGASGEFAIGFVDRNGILIDIKRATADYSCNVVYGKLRYTGQYSFNVKFSVPKSAVGFVVYSTAYDLYADWALMHSNNSNITISNSHAIYISYNGDDLSGSVVPIPPAGGGSVGDLENIEGNIKDSASGGIEDASGILDQFSNIISSYTPSFLAVTEIFDCFVNVPFFGVLVIVSVAIGILPIILNIAMDVGRWSESRSAKAERDRDKAHKKTYEHYRDTRSRRESYARRYNKENRR